MYKPLHSSWKTELPVPERNLAAPPPEKPVSITEELRSLSSLESISDARTILIRMLQNTLRTRIHNTLFELYEQAQQMNTGQVVKAFQELLQTIEHWNSRILNAEADEIRSQRPDLEEVLTGSFVATFMVLASVRGQNDDEVRVKVPSAEAFIHDCYITVGREIFSTPFLYTNVNDSNFVDYRDRAMQIIDRAIEATVYAKVSVQKVMQFPGPRPTIAAPIQAPLTRANLETIIPEDSVSQQSRKPSQKSIQLQSTRPFQGRPERDRSQRDSRQGSRQDRNSRQLRDSQQDRSRRSRSSPAGNRSAYTKSLQPQLK